MSTSLHYYIASNYIRTRPIFVHVSTARSLWSSKRDLVCIRRCFQTTVTEGVSNIRLSDFLIHVHRTGRRYHLQELPQSFRRVKRAYIGCSGRAAAMRDSDHLFLRARRAKLLVSVRKVNAEIFKLYLSVSVKNAARCTLHVLSAI